MATVSALSQSDVPGYPCRRGKVRATFTIWAIVSSSWPPIASAPSTGCLPTRIPDKGRILTALTLFWLDFLASPNHLLSTDLAAMGPAFAPSERPGRPRLLVRKATVVPIECVVRGYLAGSGWKEYPSTAAVCGIALPAGLRQAERLPEPIFTPATKAESGHDQNISFEQMAASHWPGRGGRAARPQPRHLSPRRRTRAADAASSWPTPSSSGAGCRRARSFSSTRC